MSARFDIEALNRDPELVAILLSSDDVFGFLNRQFSVPPSCAALVWGTSAQPWLAPAGYVIEAATVEELLLVRAAPVSLEYHVGQLSSKDGFPFTASVRIAAQVVVDASEMLAFRKALMGSSNRVQAHHLGQLCEETVRAALAEFAGSREAARLATATSWQEFDVVLAERVQPGGFAAGLALGADPQVTLESAAYAQAREAELSAGRRQKQIETEAQLRATATAARAKHLAELGRLIDQVKGIAASSGGLDVAGLARTFDVAQRGALYEGLVTLNQLVRQTEAILVLAGNEMIWLDPANPEVPQRRQELGSAIGPLRSIRPFKRDDERLLLVGAKRGVHVVVPWDEGRQTYMLPEDVQPRGGVNAASLVGEDVYATHSEVGLIRWNRAEPTKHELCLEEVTRGARAVRDVQVDDVGRLWLTDNNLVVGWHPEKDAAPIVLSAPAFITSMLLADGYVVAGLTSGGIVRWHTANPTEIETLRGPGNEPVHSLDWMSGGGIPRMLIADGQSYLTLQVLGDAYRAEYRCGRRLRWGFAADDLIVGVDDARTQIIVWRVDNPREPDSVVSIGRICGRSIHDVAILKVAGGSEAPPESESSA